MSDEEAPKSETIQHPMFHGAAGPLGESNKGSKSSGEKSEQHLPSHTWAQIINRAHVTPIVQRCFMNRENRVSF